MRRISLIFTTQSLKRLISTLCSSFRIFNFINVRLFHNGYFRLRLTDLRPESSWMNKQGHLNKYTMNTAPQHHGLSSWDVPVTRIKTVHFTTFCLYRYCTLRILFSGQAFFPYDLSTCFDRFPTSQPLFYSHFFFNNFIIFMTTHMITLKKRIYHLFFRYSQRYGNHSTGL